MEFKHIPVLFRESIDALDIKRTDFMQTALRAAAVIRTRYLTDSRKTAGSSPLTATPKRLRRSQSVSRAERMSA